MDYARNRNWRDVPIPPRMQHLPRDRRGLPIPFVVLRDKDDQPHFTINDTTKSLYCLKHDLCPISGTPLSRGRWFVGGPLSAFHQDGAYVDLPSHLDCIEYALQVCPYLAAPKYARRLDDATVDYERLDHKVLVDPSMNPDRPPLFVAVMAIGQSVRHLGFGQFRLRPKRPYRRVEFWRYGARLSQEEGERLVAEALSGPLPKMQQNCT